MQFTESDLWPLLGVPVSIFLARLVDVTLGTFRIALVARGRRSTAPFIGFLEILTWLIALGLVVQNLDKPINYLAYAGGFAAGTWLGLLVDEKLGPGLVSARVITAQDSKALIDRLETEHFGVTHVAARGLAGRVRLIFSVMRRQDLPRLLAIVRQFHPTAFVSVSDVRLAKEGYLGTSGQSYSLLQGLRGKK